MKDGEPIAVALGIEDRALAERLCLILGGVDGLRVAADGEPARLVLTSVREKPEDTLLTERELEVVSLLAEGLSNKEIARALGISVDTAKFHVGRVIGKLDASGRTDAVAHAARLGVIHL